MNQDDRVGSYSFSSPCKPHLLRRRGLYVDQGHIDAQILGQTLLHFLNMSAQAGFLGNNSGIHVAGSESPLPQFRYDLAQEDAAVDSLQLRIGIGKMSADIAQPGRTQQGIAQGMDEHIPIRMRDQPLFVRNGDAAQHHMIPITEPVGIIAMTNANGAICV